MSESLYRDTLKDHMHHQRFAGRLEPADLKAVVHNPLCGDELELTIVLGGDPQKVLNARFKKPVTRCVLVPFVLLPLVDGKASKVCLGRGK